MNPVQFGADLFNGRLGQVGQQAQRQPVEREGLGIVGEQLRRLADDLQQARLGDNFRRAQGRNLDILEPFLGRNLLRGFQGRVDDIFRLANDPNNRRAVDEAVRLNKLDREAGGRGNLNAVDIQKFSGVFATLSEKAKLAGDAFDKLAEKIVPGFGKRIEDLTARLSKPEEKPFTDFKKDIDAVNLLDNPGARLLGKGIAPEEGARLRGELGKELIEKFGKKKPSEFIPFKSAPLAFKGSQVGEKLITDAILDFENAKRKAEEEAENKADKSGPMHLVKRFALLPSLKRKTRLPFAL